ncbi:MAG TPA: hypothetical protein VGC47_02715 [Acidimicrobiia bacterium]
MDLTEPIHQQVRGATEPMEAAVYALLERLDGYRSTMERLIAEQEATGEPNEALVRRLRQFIAKAERMTAIVEDEVITELLFCIDRLFSVKDAEEGTFI